MCACRSRPPWRADLIAVQRVQGMRLYWLLLGSVVASVWLDGEPALAQIQSNIPGFGGLLFHRGSGGARHRESAAEMKARATACKAAARRQRVTDSNRDEYLKFCNGFSKPPSVADWLASRKAATVAGCSVAVRLYGLGSPDDIEYLRYCRGFSLPPSLADWQASKAAACDAAADRYALSGADHDKYLDYCKEQQSKHSYVPSLDEWRTQTNLSK